MLFEFLEYSKLPEPVAHFFDWLLRPFFFGSITFGIGVLITIILRFLVMPDGGWVTDDGTVIDGIRMLAYAATAATFVAIIALIPVWFWKIFWKIFSIFGKVSFFILIPLAAVLGYATGKKMMKY